MVRDHLKKVKRGYWSHARHACGLSLILLRLSASGVVHAFFPNTNVTTMSAGIDKLKHKIWQENQRILRKGRNG